MAKYFHFTTPVMGSRGVCLLLLGCGGLLQTSIVPVCGPRWGVLLWSCDREISALFLKEHMSKCMKGDIGMAKYEKLVEQEAAYPIPLSLYNCYRTVRHEKRGIAI